MNTILTLEGRITTVTPFTAQVPNRTNDFAKSVTGLPLIKSSTIRGWLRHSVHNAITDMAAHQGIKFNLVQHHHMGLGLDVHNQLSKISQTERKKLNRKLKEQNPFFAVFGRWLSSGRLVVNNAIAQSNESLIQIEHTGSTNILDNSPYILKQIEVDEISELDSIFFAKAVAPNTQQTLKNEIRNLQEKLNTPNIDPHLAKLIENTIKTHEKSMHSLGNPKDASTNRKINNFFALAENSQLNHSMRLNNPSSKDFVFLMWSIFTASKHPMGGKVGQGFGQINFEWDIYTESLFDIKRKHIGTVGFDQKKGFYLYAVDNLEDVQKLLKKENFDIEVIAKMINEQCCHYGQFS